MIASGGDGRLPRGGMLQTRSSDVRVSMKDEGMIQIGQEWPGGEIKSH